MLGSPEKCDVLFCIPVYNDWASANSLLLKIDSVIAEQRWQARVLFIDDGSSDDFSGFIQPPISLQKVEVLRLRSNVGHQRAIALGITYIFQHRPCSYVVIMDADGEDAPSDVVALMQIARESTPARIVFAQRATRSEGPVFKLFYKLFQFAHLAIVGRKMDIGNFSVVPHPLLDRLVGIGDLWNHYAAAAVKARLPITKTPISRSHRFEGKSKMNFSGLVTHGLSAISVYGDDIGARFLLASVFLVIMTLVCLVLVASIRLFTSFAISGWASYAMLGLVGILVNSLLLCIAFCFLILRSRNASTFIPLRDYPYFITRVETIHDQ